jgi:hypothetical protein
MNEQIKLSESEFEISNTLYRNRIDYLIKLGEIKLSELTNEKMTEEIYFNMTELNTREAQFMGSLNEKYGPGNIELSTGNYIKNI